MPTPVETTQSAPIAAMVAQLTIPQQYNEFMKKAIESVNSECMVKVHLINPQ